MSTEKHYTIEDVEQAFKKLSATMQLNNSPEKEAFVVECLSVAAQYLEKVGTNVAGFTGLRISDTLAIVTLICGGGPPNIKATVYSVKDNIAGREYTPSEIVRFIGANNFARMLCDALDQSRAFRESIQRDGEHIDHYMRERVAKAKADAAQLTAPVGPSN